MVTAPRVTAAALIVDFTRIARVDGEIHLQVAVIRWPEPHEPTLEWTTFRRWKKPPTSQRLADAQQKALMAHRYFRVCQRCGERKNVGHMHDGTVCQSCAAMSLGIVY